MPSDSRSCALPLGSPFGPVWGSSWDHHLPRGPWGSHQSLSSGSRGETGSEGPGSGRRSESSWRQSSRLSCSACWALRKMDVGRRANGGCTDRVPLGHDRILSEGRKGGWWKGHPAPAALALEARAGQLCEVWRPSRGPAVSAVTTPDQDPESERGLWSKTAYPLGSPALLPSCMANTWMEAHVPLWEYLWVSTPRGARACILFLPPSQLPPGSVRVASPVCPWENGPRGGSGLASFSTVSPGLRRPLPGVHLLLGEGSGPALASPTEAGHVQGCREHQQASPSLRSTGKRQNHLETWSWWARELEGMHPGGGGPSGRCQGPGRSRCETPWRWASIQGLAEPHKHILRASMSMHPRSPSTRRNKAMWAGSKR